MPRKVIWSYEATTDLNSAAEYIARDSSFYAASFVEKILTASRALDMFAERGRIVPELGNPHIREIFVGNYRLVYLVEESKVVMLGLIHGRRDMKSLWKKKQRKN